METLTSPQDDALLVTVDVVEPLGSQNLLTIRVGDQILKVSTRPDMDIRTDQQVWLRFPTHLVRLMDAETGEALALNLDKALA
jgi:multiple sugar transport system ATP-binding protein